MHHGSIIRYEKNGFLIASCFYFLILGDFEPRISHQSEKILYPDVLCEMERDVRVLIMNNLLDQGVVSYLICCLLLCFNSWVGPNHLRV